MSVIRTEELTPTTPLTASEQHQTYCGLDTGVTGEVLEELLRTHNDIPLIYNFERALQAPYLEMMMRGFAVDETSRRSAIKSLENRIISGQAILDEYARAVWDKPLNPRSPAQLKDFFYSRMNLPEVWINVKGVRKVSTNRDSLEKLEEKYLHARPFVSLILDIRDWKKQQEFFELEADAHGRIHTSYNIAGTECIAGDSLIWTKSGMRTIKEIYESPYQCAVWDGEKFVYPLRKVRYSDREGFKITLENGYVIKCSANHPLLTKQGWKQAQHITAQDELQINMGLPILFGQHAVPRGSAIELMSEDFCEFIGMWLADGSLNCNSEHYRCRLSNSDKKAQQRFITLANSVFGVTASAYGDEVVFSSKEICTWLKQIGLNADEGLGTASWKEIPKLLLRGKPNLIRALLRGLTLDSHQTEKGLIYGTQSYKMQDQIQQCLLLLGIKSVKMHTGNSTGLNVPRSYCGRFLSLVGFVQEQKAVSLSLLLNQRCQWHEPESFGSKLFLPIYNIETWKGDVYDLTMPDSPQYVAQGFTVHNTGRPSSSSDAFGRGGNLQNVAPNLRYVLVADHGWKLCVIDLEQVEARDVGYFCGVLFGRWGYLDSCEQGDLHTNVTKMVWPRELPWTGDGVKDKWIAENTIYYRDWPYRFMSKRGAHLSNYMGTAWTAARILKMPLPILEDFQARYCKGDARKGIEPAFPEIAMFWQWCAEKLQTDATFTTPFGRKRQFFGRPGDDATLREAIANLPQSTTADRTNLVLWRIWRYMPEVQVLAQTYDSITFQYREDANEDEIIGRALEHFAVPLTAPNGRKYVVPAEAKIGWNWGNATDPDDVARARAKGVDVRLNLDGLKKWKPGKPDTRKRAVGLDRVMQ